MNTVDLLYIYLFQKKDMSFYRFVYVRSQEFYEFVNANLLENIYFIFRNPLFFHPFVTIWCEQHPRQMWWQLNSATKGRGRCVGWAIRRINWMNWIDRFILHEDHKPIFISFDFREIRLPGLQQKILLFNLTTSFWLFDERKICQLHDHFAFSKEKPPALPPPHEGKSILRPLTLHELVISLLSREFVRAMVIVDA